jgi:hypothetical protein
MEYSKSKLKNNVDKASPCFRPQQAGNALDKRLPTQDLLQVSSKHNLIKIQPI